MGTWSTTEPIISGDWSFIGQSTAVWPGWYVQVTTPGYRWNPETKKYEPYGTTTETQYISFGLYTKNYVARTRNNEICLCTDIYTRYGGDSAYGNTCTVYGYAKDENGEWVQGPGISGIFGSSFYSRGKLYYTLPKTYKFDTAYIGAIYGTTSTTVSTAVPASIGSPIYLKKDGKWLSTVQWVKVNGKWIQADSIQLKVNNAWKS